MMMHRFLLALFSALIFSFYSRAQVVSYELQDSYTQQGVDSIFQNAGVNIPFPIAYGVDIYKVIYKTSYRHIDSLVDASGVIVVPRGVTCGTPLALYAHGTTSNRFNVPSYGSGERLIGVIFSGLAGVVSCMPDYLGLGDSDSTILVHPYVNKFHQGHSSINILRAARNLAGTLNYSLNDELFLSGYSQGGFVAVATHRLIEEEYSNEFTVTGNVPMSGAYDLKEAQVDLLVSDSAYATPGYLPYILFGYHSIFPSLRQLYPDINSVFKPPYDTLLAPLFYAKTNGIGYINGLCEPVPKHMLWDTLVENFENDSLHPLRLALAESHLLDWTPQAPVNLLYCREDEQVSYLNSVRAFDSWTARGAQDITKADLGDLSHGGCVEPALLNAAIFVIFNKSDCTALERFTSSQFKLFPNPASDVLNIRFAVLGNYQVLMYSLDGRLIKTGEFDGSEFLMDVSDVTSGNYLVVVQDGQGRVGHRQVVVE